MVLCLMTILLMIEMPRKATRKLVISLSSFIQMAYKSILNLVYLLVDQENLTPRSWPARILWLHVCIATFVTIFGCLLNLMSVDMVAVMKYPEISSLEALLNDNEFKHIQPVIFKALPLYGLAKNADPISKLGQFYHRVLRDPAKGLVDVDTSNEDPMYLMSKRAQITDAMNDKTQIMTVVRYIWESLIKPGGCISRPHYIQNSYVSKESFAMGIGTTFYSKLADKHLVRYFEYSFRNIMEFGLLAPSIIECAHFLATRFAFEPGKWASVQCQFDLIDKDYGTVDGQQLLSYKLILIVSSTVLVAATLFLIVERLTHRFSPNVEIRCNVTFTRKRRKISQDNQSLSGQLLSARRATVA